MGTEIESERENIACISFTCAELNSAMQSRHFFSHIVVYYLRLDYSTGEGANASH